MKNKIPSWVVWVLLLILIIELVYLVVMINRQPGRYDTFASCLKEKNLTFYGAFWCPHCQEQKALFGKSAKLLPYVECSTPDGQDQTPICKEKQITQYPTWQLPNGERREGTLPLQELSDISGCPLK